MKLLRELVHTVGVSILIKTLERLTSLFVFNLFELACQDFGLHEANLGPQYMLR